MKINIKADPLKYCVNFTFMLISAGLLVYILPKLVEGDKVLQALFVVIALGADIVKQYSLMKAKEKMKIPFYCLYGIITASLLVISVGFSMSLVNLTATQAKNRKAEIAISINAIESRDHEIKLLTSELDKIPATNWRYWQVSGKLSTLRAQQEKSIASIKSTVIIETNESKRDIYGALNEVTGIPGEWIKFFTLFVILLFIDIVLFITHWDEDGVSALKHEPQQPEGLRAFIIAHRVNLMRYIDALCRETSEALNGDNKICEKLAITRESALQYRRTLASVRVGGKPLIETTQGGSRRNFTAEEMKQYIARI